jgi:Kef-type K+ transport system membrane component KefB
MQSLSHHQIVILFLQVSLMLIAGKVLGETAKKLKQPTVIGEIIAGIILGPTVLGAVFPDIMHEVFPVSGASPLALHGLTSISIVLLLFVAGLEVELRMVLHQGIKAILTSSFGITTSFLLGFGACLLLPVFLQVPTDKYWVYALFMGVALSITSLPVIARTLMDLGIFKSHVGMLIIAAAMLDDVIGWVAFSVILGMLQTNTETPVYVTVVATLLFTVITLTLVRRLLDRSLPWINHNLSFPGGILAFSITLAFLCGAFTEAIGIHAIFGSFIVGIALGDSIHMSRRTKEIIHDFVNNIFAPLFFVSIGLKVNFIEGFDSSLVALILLLAMAGKIIGCSVGAKLGGFTMREALAVGSGMNARGAMGIILATLALQVQLIGQEIFIALVVMSLITSMLSGYMIRYFLPKDFVGSSAPQGYILLGDNEISQFLAKYLTDKKIPVLIVDTSKKINLNKYDWAVFNGNVLDKGVIERLDLSRYGYFLALSEEDELNEKACVVFEQEVGEDKVFRLITKKESKSASLSLAKNLLFRGIHWNFAGLDKIIRRNHLEITKISFDSEEKLDKFIAFNNHRKQIIPLFVQKDKQLFEPISSFPLQIKEGNFLIYVDIPADTPQPHKAEIQAKRTSVEE